MINLGKGTQMWQGTLLSSPPQIPLVTESRLQEDTLCFLNLFSWPFPSVHKKSRNDEVKREPGLCCGQQREFSSEM